MLNAVCGQRHAKALPVVRAVLWHAPGARAFLAQALQSRSLSKVVDGVQVLPMARRRLPPVAMRA